MATIQEIKKQLQETNQAISAIKKGGQEIAIRDRRLRQADLAELRAEKAELERQLAEAQALAASGGGGSWATPMHYFGKR